MVHIAGHLSNDLFILCRFAGEISFQVNTVFDDGGGKESVQSQLKCFAVIIWKLGRMGNACDEDQFLRSKLLGDLYREHSPE